MVNNDFSLFLNNRSIDIEFQNISYAVKQNGIKTQLIKGVSGKFLSGELTAIMGPSGAGKTTLLNILTGMQMRDFGGTINCNSAAKNGASQYKRESCYILQDDNLPDLFTVLEIMNIAAALKLKNISEKRKKQLVDDILDNLSLKLCINTRCQHLSGGQRKRVSVALELIDNPPIMFLDEPTTGLDSSSALLCIRILKNLAIGGRTIICTIHQPSATIYEMFDHVYVMARGYCVYKGSTTNTVRYLSSLGFDCPQYHSPADFLLEVVNCGTYIELLTNAVKEEKWRALPNVKTIQEIKTTFSEVEDMYKSCQAPSELIRLWILLCRCEKQLIRDWTTSQLKLVLHILVGIFLGFTFLDSGKDAAKVHSNLGFMLCGVLYICYTSLMPGVLKFPSELAILKKERFNNWYKLKTYFVAFLITDIPTQAIFSIAYTVSSYLISSQPMEWRRISMVLIIQILVGLVSSSLGLLLGSVVNPINGTFWGAIILAIMLTCSGFFIMFTHMTKWMYWITYFSFLSYAVEGLMQAVYGYNRDELECSEAAIYCHYKNPNTLLKYIGMDKQNYWIDVGYLLIIFITLRWASFFTLKNKLSKT